MPETLPWKWFVSVPVCPRGRNGHISKQMNIDCACVIRQATSLDGAGDANAKEIMRACIYLVSAIHSTYAEILSVSTTIIHALMPQRISALLYTFVSIYRQLWSSYSHNTDIRTSNIRLRGIAAVLLSQSLYKT